MKNETIMYNEARKLTNALIIEFSSAYKSSWLNRESMGNSPNNSIGFYMENIVAETRNKIQLIFFNNNNFNRFWGNRRKLKALKRYDKMADIINSQKNVISNQIDIPENLFQELNKLSGQIQ